MPRLIAFSLALASLSIACGGQPALASDWTTFGFDAAHTNFNPRAGSLDLAHVRRLRLGWSTPLGGVIDTQPAYASRVAVGRRRRMNLVFAATEHAAVFAIDARSGRVLWRRQLRQRRSLCWMNTPDSRFGISATPIVDRRHNRLYVVPADNSVHALSLSTGHEARGWPVPLGFTPATHHIWGSSTLVGDDLYVPVASYCDVGRYRGGIALVSVRRRRVIRRWYVVGPTLAGGGVWGWGGVPIDLADRNVYVTTSNANGPTEDAGYAEHVVRLTRDLRVLDADDPDVGIRADADFASAPLLFRPTGCAPLLAAIHKNGILFVYRRHALHQGPIQRIDGLGPTGTFAWSPVRQTIYVTYVGPGFQGLVGFRVSRCELKAGWRVAVQRSMWVPSPPTVAGDVVYFGTGQDREIVAAGGRTGHVLWRTGAGTIVAAPTVIDGHLFAGSWDQRVYAFSASR